MLKSDHKFDTLQVHAGSRPDPSTGARQVPIYQNTAYVFKSILHAEALFDLKELGHIYSRLSNPTVSVLQERLAALEGGIGAICSSSGHSAQILALFPLMQPGDNLIASTRLYGGTVQQFSNTIKKFGWQAKFVDVNHPSQIHSLADSKTKAIFCESISNPGGHVTDLPRLAKIAKDLSIPLIVDNTAATPYLCNPFKYGADLIVHSTTKYISGNGTSLGGAVIDSGNFNWSQRDKFPSLSEPEPGYHGLKFHDTFGPYAFIIYSIAVSLRDLGMTMAPQNAFHTLLGLETLSLRMKKHVTNAKKIAQWLDDHPDIGEVTYAGLKTSKYAQIVKKIYPRGAGALFTIALNGGYDACLKLVNNVNLFSHVANLGDTRSLIIHPASTIHRQLTEEQQIEAGLAPNVVRLSIGIEDPTDLIKDLKQALE
ncbi:MAG: O-acetylhomoserine aminocarboxypropyltransferase/cysteine synthase [Paracoccaceae bacterium]|nr:O-acetylhomoserine aminocarboxypropyltransferase/cysteine synthase [Paracoccaceae bacterium]